MKEREKIYGMKVRCINIIHVQAVGILTYLITYLLTYLLTSELLTYLLIYLHTYWITYWLIDWLTDLLTYSMVQSPSWEANWFAASQEIPRISRNQKVHYRTHKRPPPVSILGQPNPVHIHTSHHLGISQFCLHEINILSISFFKHLLSCSIV